MRLAAERPAQTAQLAGHRHRIVALRHDTPRLVEDESMDRRGRTVLLKADLALFRRDAALGEAAGPGGHRVAAPPRRERARARIRLWQDPLDATDEQRHDPAPHRGVDRERRCVALELDHASARRNALRAACAPHIPCTPPPGGVAALQR